MSLALEFLGIETKDVDLRGHHVGGGAGPRGGDVESVHCPEARRTGFQGEKREGLPGLHRFEPYKDIAVAGIQNEQPWHRMAALMIAHGHTAEEVAEYAGVTKEMVYVLRCQRWFRELMTDIVNDAGQIIAGALEGYSLEALDTIANLMRTSPNDRVKLQASTTLLEHYKGKAVQATIQHHKTTQYASPEDEYEALGRELEMLRKSRGSLSEVQPLKNVTEINKQLRPNYG